MKRLALLTFFALQGVGCAGDPIDRNPAKSAARAPQSASAVSVAATGAKPAAMVTASSKPDAPGVPVGKPYYTMTSESSAAESSSPDGAVQTVTNTTFAFTSLYNPQKQNSTDKLLIAQKVVSTTFPNQAGPIAKLEAIAWLGNKESYDTKLWTVNDCADTGWRSGDFYWTSKYGPEGTENLLRAYNFKTGKYSFTFTAEPVTADIHIPDGTVKRYVAYVSRKGADSECRKNELPKGAIGALTLSDGNSQSDRIVLEVQDEAPQRSPEISLIDKKEVKGAKILSVWGPGDFSHTREVVNGFSVKVFFEDGRGVIIPVTNDRFDIDAATLPRAITIRRIGVENTDGGKS